MTKYRIQTLLSSLLIASVLGGLIVLPDNQAFAGHIVTAGCAGSCVTGIAFTADGIISDIDDASVTIGEDFIIQDGTPLLTFDDTGGVSDSSITSNAGVLIIDPDTSLGNNSITIAADGDITLDTADPISIDGTTNAGRLTISDGVTVTAEGLTVTAGGATITAGDLSMVSGTIVDTNGNVIINDGMTIGLAGAETFSIATGGTDTINIGTDNTSIDDINIGSATDNFAIQSDAFEVTDAGVLSDRGGNLVLGDTVDIGSSVSGLRVDTQGVILDLDGNFVIDDIVNLGSAATGIRITTSGIITDIDGNVVIGEAVDLGSAVNGINVTVLGVISDNDDFVDIDDSMQLGTNGDTIFSIQAVQSGNVTFGVLAAQTETCVDAGDIFTGLSATDVITAQPSAALGNSIAVNGARFVDADSVSVCVIALDGTTPNPNDVPWNITVIELS